MDGRFISPRLSLKDPTSFLLNELREACREDRLQWDKKNQTGNVVQKLSFHKVGHLWPQFNERKLALKAAPSCSSGPAAAAPAVAAAVTAPDTSASATLAPIGTMQPVELPCLSTLSRPPSSSGSGGSSKGSMAAGALPEAVMTIRLDDDGLNLTIVQETVFITPTFLPLDEPVSRCVRLGCGCHVCM